MLVVCSLVFAVLVFVDCSLLFDVWWLLFVFFCKVDGCCFRRVLLVVECSLCVVCCLSCVMFVYSVISIDYCCVCCSLFDVCCRLYVVCCLLFFVCCLLRVGLLLFVV